MPAHKTWTAAASSSAEQHVKRRGSAIGCVEQPVAKRARAPSPVQAVAFVTCTENSQNFATDRDRRKLVQTVHNALESGAIIVNLAFTTIIDKDIVDPGAIFPELKQLFDEVWKNSVALPAWSFRRSGSVMTFFSDACGAVLSEKSLGPEGWPPAIMLTFDAPKGPLCIVNASVPTLSIKGSACMLERYVEAAEETGSDSILIGGAWRNTEALILFMENQVSKMELNWQLSSNANLCLLTHSHDNRSAKCFALDTDGPYSFMVIWNTGSSVEPPASDDDCDSGEQPVKRKPHTPLWDGIISTLELGAQNHENGEALLSYVTHCCFFGKLRTMNVHGVETETAVPLAIKMEEMMQTTQTQRDLQLGKLRRRGSAQSRLNPAEYVMDPADMKEIYNTWRINVESWMRPSTLTEYRKMKELRQNQQAHQLGKQAFSSYIFQISGCKFLLHKLIELPLISAMIEDGSAEQSTAIALNMLINAYEEHKKSKQYAQTLRQSTQHQDGQRRLSGQVWWAQYNLTQGVKLAASVLDDEVDFLQLPAWQQQLLEDYDCGRLARALDEVLKQKAFKQQPYRGVGTETVG